MPRVGLLTRFFLRYASITSSVIVPSMKAAVFGILYFTFSSLLLESSCGGIACNVQLKDFCHRPNSAIQILTRLSDSVGGRCFHHLWALFWELRFCMKVEAEKFLFLKAHSNSFS